MIIAIDGVVASGKGSLAKGIAAHYGWWRLDTGALYRAVALAVLEAGATPEDEAAAARAAEALDLDAIDEHRIRSGPVGAAASIVAAHGRVRAALLEGQRAFAARPPGAVLDGRDIATVVAPHADVKFFVVAELPIRARRRHAELLARGEVVSLEALTAQIAERDARDASRPVAPLVRAPDAHLLDTSALTIAEGVARACAVIDERRVRPPR